MKSYLIFNLIFTALFLGVQPVISQEYYVSVAGNDANDGLSEATAWRHVNKAAQTITAGQTAIILDGIYNERVVVANSGTDGHPISIRAKNKRLAVIDGTGISISGSSAGLFQITSRKYIIIDGLKVINSTDHGIATNGPEASVIEIMNCYVENTFSSGILAFGMVGNGSYEGVVNYKVHDCEVVNATNGGYEECITVSGGCSNIELFSNYVHDSGANHAGGFGCEGLDVKYGVKNVLMHHNTSVNIVGGNAFYCDGWNRINKNVHIYSNICYGIHDNGVSLGAESNGYLDSIFVYNNIIIGGRLTGIGVSEYGHDANHLTGIFIINNTVVSGTNGIVVSDKTADVVVRNNISAFNSTSQMNVTYRNLNVTTDHNIFFGEGPRVDYGTYYVKEDPRFVNISARDFHLRGDSPAINRGVITDYPLTDVEGLMRIGSAPDCGVHEYQSVVDMPAVAEFDPADRNPDIEKTGPVNPSQNLAAGGDFEGNFSFTGDWADWGYTGISTKDRFAGKQAALVSQNITGGGFAFIEQPARDSVYYTFRAWYLMTDPIVFDPFSGYPKVAFGLLMKDKDGKRFDLENAVFEIRSPGSLWRQFKIQVYAPEGVRQVEAYIWTSSITAPVYVDNVELYESGDLSTGTGDIETSDNCLINAYPVPFADKLSVSLSPDISGPVTMEFTDVSGRLLFKKEYSGHLLDISTQLWNKGIYMLKVTDKNHKHYNKVVIKN